MLKTVRILGIFIIAVCLNSCKNEGEKDVAEEQEAATSIEPAAAPSNLKTISEGKNSTVLSRVIQMPQGTQFARYSVTAHLTDEFASEENNFLVFVPSDDAFAALGEDKKKWFSNSKNLPELTAMLKGHVVKGNNKLPEKIPTANSPLDLSTMSGRGLKLFSENDSYFLEDASGNRAKIINEGTSSSNGTVFLIDKVLTVN